MATRPFHLAWFLSQGYGPKSWRSDFPGTDVSRWMMPDLFVDLAQGMERACFDYIMLEDTLMVSEAYGGSAEAALKHFRKAVDLDPNYADAHYRLGKMYFDKGDLDGTITHLRKGLRPHADQVNAWGAFGRALLRKGQFAEARAATLTCLKLLSPNHRLLPLVRKRKLACTVGTIGLRGCRTSDMPVAVKSSPSPGICRANSGAICPKTSEKLTPAFSNTPPSTRTRDRPQPPPARCQTSSRKLLLPSASSRLRQMRSCKSLKKSIASVRSRLMRCMPGPGLR